MHQKVSQAFEMEPNEKWSDLRLHSLLAVFVSITL